MTELQVPPDRDAKRLVEAIHAEAKHKPGTSMARRELSLARIEDHATRLATLLAERDPAAKALKKIDDMEPVRGEKWGDYAMRFTRRATEIAAAALKEAPNG